MKKIISLVLVAIIFVSAIQLSGGFEALLELVVLGQIPMTEIRFDVFAFALFSLPILYVAAIMTEDIRGEIMDSRIDQYRQEALNIATTPASIDIEAPLTVIDTEDIDVLSV